MQYLTVKDVARILKLSPTTVRRHIRSGKLQAVRFGRALRVPEDWLLGLAQSTEAEREQTGDRRRRALARTDKLHEEILERRAGVPLPDSAPLIRAMRDGGSEMPDDPAEPDTEATQRQWRAALKRAAQLRERALEDRNGVPVPNSAPLIRAMREGRLR